MKLKSGRPEPKTQVRETGNQQEQENSSQGVESPKKLKAGRPEPGKLKSARLETTQAQDARHARNSSQVAYKKLKSGTP